MIDAMGPAGPGPRSRAPVGPAPPTRTREGGTRRHTTVSSNIWEGRGTTTKPTAVDPLRNLIRRSTMRGPRRVQKRDRGQRRTRLRGRGPRSGGARDDTAGTHGARILAATSREGAHVGPRARS